MTKEEAIHILRDSKPSTIMKEGEVFERVADVCIAIDIAIESLKQITCYLDSPCEYQNPDIKIPRCVILTEERNNKDMVSRSDVISICNILADKMDDEGRVAVEQVRDAVKDMRPYEGSEADAE